jgi:DNA modification methylase
MSILIGALSTSDDIVLDPYMGSGTTGVACIKLGRRFIGIEKELEYFNIAVDRIKNAFADDGLYTGAIAAAEVNKDSELFT